MRDRAHLIELPDGTQVWARVSRLDISGDPDEEYNDVGVWDALGARVEGLRELVGGVADSVRAAAERVAPDETSVSFGVEVAAKPGRAVALLADGEAKANLSVTLTWRRERERAAADQGRSDGRGPDDSGV
ncbi:CU044_2847 family protein [Streptomyces rimosus]|uniref:CU044_2847 family protein n=1 Tax=Streptomyces rimosus TaxID=1927 RepID=UPI0004CAF214|nr:CU044_2847 family protein [Streptomyces rimosus]